MNARTLGLKAPSLKVLCLLGLVAAAACDDDGGGSGNTPADTGASLDGAAGAGGAGAEGGEGGQGAEGGEGGQGGQGAEGGQGGAGAAGGQGGEGGGEPDAACVAACDTVATCAETVCVANEALDARALCLAGCPGVPVFPSVVAGTAACTDTISYARQALGAAFADACQIDPTAAPELPACVDFGASVVRCTAPTCAPLGADAELAGAVARGYQALCNRAVTLGALAPDDVATYFGGGTECTSVVLRDFTAEQRQPGATLAALCSEQPPQGPTVERCAEACAIIAPCFPPEGDAGALRNPDFCAMYCLTDRTRPTETWDCIAEANDCTAAFTCLNANSPPCPDFAARVSACVTAACPGAAPAESALAGVLDNLCSQGTLTPDVTAGVTPETDCAAPTVAPWVQFLSVDTPNEPDDGTVAPMCAAMGPISPPETCTPACATFARCVPAGNPAEALRDGDTCTLSCLAGTPGITPESWACLATTEDCAAVPGCF